MPKMRPPPADRAKDDFDVLDVALFGRVCSSGHYDHARDTTEACAG